MKKRKNEKHTTEDFVFLRGGRETGGIFRTVLVKATHTIGRKLQASFSHISKVIGKNYLRGFKVKMLYTLTLPKGERLIDHYHLVFLDQKLTYSYIHTPHTLCSSNTVETGTFNLKGKCSHTICISVVHCSIHGCMFFHSHSFCPFFFFLLLSCIRKLYRKEISLKPMTLNHNESHDVVQCNEE